jgi:hypothetical protein
VETAPSFLEQIRLRSIIKLGRSKSKKDQQHSLLPAEPANDLDDISAEQVTGLSADTLKRRYPDYIRDLSDRRLGMLLGDALDIAAGKIQPKSMEGKCKGTRRDEPPSQGRELK